MAQATVFVDDAVRGRLPQVCAKTGVPTTDLLRVRESMGDRAGFGIAWLLLLAGPIGWIGLAIMAMARSGRAEELEVRLPYSEAAYQHLRTARRTETIGLWTVLLTVAAGFLFLIGAGAGTLARFGAIALLVAFTVGVVLMVTGSIRHRAARVSVDLDASRRWVRVGRVHPAFAAACEADDRARDRV